MFNIGEGAELVERGDLSPSGGVVVDGEGSEDIGFGCGETPGGISRRLCK